MDMTDLRVLGTVLMAVAFAAVVFWAFGPSRRKYFDEAANLPFEDEEDEPDEEKDGQSGEKQ